MITEPLQAATALTQAGFAVVPTQPNSREIWVTGWTDLCLPLDRLPQHFNGQPQNVSINWKQSGGRCALDLDSPEAEELAQLLLPRDTPAFGRGGRLRQVVFECADATNLQLKYNSQMLVEVLAAGSASLAPGSTQPEGDLVQWCAGRSPAEYRPRRVSAERLRHFANIMAGAGLLLRYWRDVAGQGVRHDTALQLAGAMLHGGWKPAAVRKVLRSVFLVAADPEVKDRMAAVDSTIKLQEAGQPFCGLPELSKGMPPDLVAGLVRFFALGGVAADASGPAPAAPGAAPDELLLTWANTVPPERVDWHWRGVLAAGKLSLLAGDPGVGKSTISGAVTACYTTGRPFPGATDSRPPKRVLVAAAEDSAADTKVPRLMAAGADLSKVAFCDLVRTGARERYFTLLDVPVLDALLSRYPSEFGLLVIDPVGGYLGGRDSHRDADVRELLRPLAVMADRHRIAVLCIAHLNKSSMHNAMNRVTGSGAFVAAARLPWLIAKDPADPSTRLMVPLKSNLTETLDGISYHVEKELLPDGAEASRIVWHDLPVKLTADELLQRQTSHEAPGRQEAEDWLRQRLADGPVTVRALKDESDLLPYSWDTLKRAAKQLGIQGSGEKKQRLWMLPEQASAAVVQVDFGQRKQPAPVSLEEVPVLKD